MDLSGLGLGPQAGSSEIVNELHNFRRSEKSLNSLNDQQPLRTDSDCYQEVAELHTDFQWFIQRTSPNTLSAEVRKEWDTVLSYCTLSTENVVGKFVTGLAA